MAVVEKQHLAVAELRRFCRPGSRAQGIVGPRGEYKRIIGHDFGLDIPDLRLEGDQGSIQGSGIETSDQRLGFVFQPYRREPWIGSPERRRCAWQQIGGDGWDHTDSKCACERIAGPLCYRNQIVRFEE